MTELPQVPDESDLRPSAARLAESLRDTGYSKEAAFADIVDNAIAANATRITIELIYHLGDLRVIFTDDGDGMSQDQLRSAMRYGSPKRESPKSLGKFGMGLKTASTAFCRRLVVISLCDDKEALRAWDLDRIIKTDLWELETPVRDDYIDDLDELHRRSPVSGTMVIWEKVDRLVNDGSEGRIRKQMASLGKDISDELAAIYFKFLAGGDVTIAMKIGDEPEYFLKGWDPLCRDLNREKEDARARLLKEKVIQIDGPSELNFSVRGSIIPSRDELTSDELKEVRYGLDNQGLYIYREGRLIWHDGWPHRMYKKESKITRLRVELCFDHELDDVFGIDFRKSRVIIPLEIRKKLQELIAPWRNEVSRRQTTGGGEKPNSDHGPSNKAIDRHKDNTRNAEISVGDGKALIRNKNQREPALIEGVRIYDDNTIRVQEEDSLSGDNLWEPGLDVDGNTCVSLGKSHPFYNGLYNLCKADPDALKALDMLLWSLAHAEYGEYSETNKTTLAGYRGEVSKTLRYLSLELPDSDEE